PSIFSVDAVSLKKAAVINEDGRTVNSASAPAAKGSVISIYATGEGQTAPAGTDGLIATILPLPRPAKSVTVRIDGQPAEVQYAGAAPGQVAGLMQVNVKIPVGVASGPVPIEIQVGACRSQAGMTIVVR